MGIEALYTPRQMVAGLRQVPPLQTFFLDKFFSGSPEVFHNTEHVTYDVFKGRRHLAEYRRPMDAARVVRRRGKQTFAVSPAYISEKMPIEPKDADDRQFGQDAYEAGRQDPMERIRQIQLENTVNLRDRRLRRIEQMCAEVLRTFRLHIVGEGIDDVVDFGGVVGDNLITLSGTSAWNGGGDIIGDLDAWTTMILKRCGLHPDIIVVGEKVPHAFRLDPEVRKQLDIQNMNFGNIEFGPRANGVRRIGVLNPPGIEIFQYLEWYIDPVDGIEKPMLGEDEVIIGSTRAGCQMHYGQIQNFKAELKALREFPFTYEELDGKGIWTQLESAPLANPFQIDAFICAKVLNP